MSKAFLEPSELDLSMNRARNKPVFCEGDVSGAIYQVESGCIRLQKISNGGHRTVLSFCFPGDLFGLGVNGPGEVDAEAVCLTRVSRLGQTGLAKLVHGDTRRGLAVMEAACGGHEQLAEHFALISHAGAEQRFAWFLNRLGVRLGRPVGDLLCVDLPMMRADIADHLGMTFETVSRELTKLRNSKIIEVVGLRRLLVARPGALARLARGDSPTFLNRAQGVAGPALRAVPGQAMIS